MNTVSILTNICIFSSVTDKYQEQVNMVYFLLLSYMQRISNLNTTKPEAPYNMEPVACDKSVCNYKIYCFYQKLKKYKIFTASGMNNTTTVYEAFQLVFSSISHSFMYAFTAGS